MMRFAAWREQCARVGQSVTSARRLALAESAASIRELENAKVWLDEQRQRWQQLAEE
jgi:hypothetical protein